MDSIDDAVAAMDRLLERSLAAHDPRGFFTCVYRAVTVRVRDGIRAGEFDEGERMERFDVEFARLYLDAARDHELGRPVLAVMVDRMQEGLARVSPWTVLADRVGCRFDECLSAWSIGYARRRAGTSRSGWPWTRCTTSCCVRSESVGPEAPPSSSPDPGATAYPSPFRGCRLHAHHVPPCPPVRPRARAPLPGDEPT